MPLLPVLFEFIDTFIINLVHERTPNQEIEHQIFHAYSLSLELQHLPKFDDFFFTFQIDISLEH
jgi:hypothetical protein